MGKDTDIAWCDTTANLWTGCTEVSPACDHCYARELMSMDGRFKRVEWGPHGDRDYVKEGWKLLRKFQRAAERNGGIDPELGRRRRIFVNSISDTFDNHKSIVWREDAFKEFERCRDIDILLVTKRPQNVAKMVPAHWLVDGGWPQHVWLIVTVENQEEADRRIPALVSIPGVKVRGLSMEPLLGPVDLFSITTFRWPKAELLNALTGSLRGMFGDYCPTEVQPLNWIIVGGEQADNYRDNGFIENARSIFAQCEQSGVAFFGKQNCGPVGALPPLPDDLAVQEFPA